MSGLLKNLAVFLLVISYGFIISAISILLMYPFDLVEQEYIDFWFPLLIDMSFIFVFIFLFISSVCYIIDMKNRAYREDNL